MSQILVQVDATGVVSDELRNELAGVLAGQDEFGVTVLRGTVLDNAALMGLLHRLRHAGLHVINMDAMPASEPHAVGMAIADDVVTLDLRGRLDDQSASLLDGGQVIQESVTTTVRYRVASGSDLGALLNQVEALNLQLMHLNVIHPKVS
ncbi:MAG: hypothetical protein ACRC8U_07330 [Brooklawnia sp.]|jgi:hypothetical protein